MTAYHNKCTEDVIRWMKPLLVLLKVPLYSEFRTWYIHIGLNCKYVPRPDLDEAVPQAEFCF
jgi:hypothetical protein